MTALTPALDAELRGPAPTVFGAVAVDLPTGPVNLLDGSGILSFAGRTFVGEDATFGALSDVQNLSDGSGDSAPAFSMSLIPNGDAAAATLAAPNMQGAPVYVWIGAVNQTTGQPVPDPYLIFAGELDVATLDADETGRVLTYDVVSVFERLFEDDESARLSPGHHRSIFPKEAGMDFVTGVAETVYWGVQAPPSNVVSYPGGWGGLGYVISGAAQL